MQQLKTKRVSKLKDDAIVDLTDNQEVIVEKLQEVIEVVNKQAKPILLVKIKQGLSLDQTRQALGYFKSSKLEEQYTVLIQSSEATKESIELEMLIPRELTEDDISKIEQAEADFTKYLTILNQGKEDGDKSQM